MNREQEQALTQYLVDLVDCFSLNQVDKVMEAASHDGDLDNRSFRVLCHVSKAIIEKLHLLF